MGLPRTFVGFSSTDIHYFRMMLAWKEREHIDFDFANCQLNDSINSENEQYIKSICRARINLAGKFVMLIGDDTRSKHKYVRWELETAIKKKCTIIGVNLDNSRTMVPAKTPPIMQGIGALFIPFKARVIAKALVQYRMHPNDDYHFVEAVYTELGLN